MLDPKENPQELDELLRSIDRAVARESGEERRDPNPYRSAPEDPLEELDRQDEENREYRLPEDEELLYREPEKPVIRAYNADFSEERPALRRPGREPEMDDTQRRRAMEETIVRRPPAKKKPQPDTARREPPRREKPRKKRRGCGCLTALLLLVLLVGGGALLLRFALSAPKAEEGTLGTRKKDCSVILLAGTDDEGGRTDTMMLLYLDRGAKQVNLVSLPRDTLTYSVSGDPAKLNSAYGRNGRGQEGMEALLDYVQDIIGFRPDGYMLIDLKGFAGVVDAMGGVEFDVPQDMFYEDASQDLYIDLKQGRQKLNGKEALGLVRFRSGYAAADLQRVQVQRAFLSACMDQWLTPTKLFRLPKALSALQADTTDDLTTGNLLWLAMAAWRSGVKNIQSVTLPGQGDTVYGASYYLLDRQGVADTVNAYCNPYTRQVAAEDLNIAE